MCNPLKNPGNIHQAITSKNYQKPYDQWPDVELENREDTHYRHAAVNQYPNNRVGIINLDKSENQEHDGKNEVSYPHMVELSDCNMQKNRRYGRYELP